LLNCRILFLSLFVVADKPRGLVISVDLQNILPIYGAVILENCDVTSGATQYKIREVLDGRPVDLVMSDIAPSATGVSSLDHDLIVQLAMTVLRMSATLLREVNIELPVNHNAL